MSLNQPRDSTVKTVVNLDWTRDPPPSHITSYQKYIREVDWSRTGLGPRHSWRRELRQMVLFMMAEVSPVILYWGERNTMIYNEAYIPLIGSQHPDTHGMDALDVFPNFWDQFQRIIDEQRSTGQTCVGEASMLMMERHGFLEEAYFNWKLIPVVGDDGILLGSYGRPSESTIETIDTRRVACIQNLSQQISNTTSFKQLWNCAVECLTPLDKDVTFAMVYSFQRSQTKPASPGHRLAKCDLEALLGIPSSHSCAKNQLDIQEDLHGLAPSMLEAVNKDSIHVVDAAHAGLEDLFDHIEWRGFGIPSKELAFIPVHEDGVIAAVLIIGLNPRLRFANKYSDFLQMLGDLLSAQMSRLRLVDEITSHDQIARTALSDFRRSEMRFFRFADRSPLGLIITDRDGKVVYANEAWYDFCGLQEGEHELSSWIETVYEEDLSVINEWWHKVTQLKQSGTFQIRSNKPFVNGSMQMPYRTGVVAIYPDLDDEDNVISVMGLVTDISEVKWVEAELRLRQREIEASEEKYRTFAEHAPIGVVRTDTKGYVQFANDAWRSFYGYNKDDVIDNPEPWLSALHREDAPAARVFFREMIATGLAKTKTIEVRLNRRKTATEANRTSPTEFWLLSTAFAGYNRDGSISDITFWVTDISDQKAAEKLLTDKMEEAIRLKTTQERFVDMISHEIRNPLSAILHCSEEIVDAMKKCLVWVEPQSPVEPVTKNETSEETTATDYVNSALDAANTIMYCVQHQKQIVDDVLTLSKLDADLLVVSPIPVQPTEVIRSALKIFQPELKASTIELAFEIHSSLAKLEVDWIMLDPNRFLQIVINLVTNAIKFTRTSQTRRIVISASAHNERPPQLYRGVHFVPRRASESQDNDLTAALENGVDEAILSSPQFNQDLYLCFSVADTGKGLTESERITLFNRFTQASPKTHIEYGGSGLGLFISRQITEMLGGEIGVGSEPGEGATFAFYVRSRRAKPPRRRSATVGSASVSTSSLVAPTPGTWAAGHSERPSATEAAPEARSGPHRPAPSTPESTTRKRRVLVVEDNLVNQKVLCKQLRNRGFVVDAANHGREALDALERSHDHQGDERGKVKTSYDVILCDIEMPVMDGIECVSEIRRLEKEGHFSGHVPIIGVTANVRSKQVNTAIEVGMDGVTTKPYRIDDLIAHIDRVSADLRASAPT